MNVRRVLEVGGRWAGYVAFFLLCTLFFAWLGFPTERARQFVEVRGSRALGGKLEVGELALSGFDGATLRDLRYEPAKPSGSKDGPEQKSFVDRVEAARDKLDLGDDGDQPRLVRAGRLDVDAGFWGLVLGSEQRFDLSGELQGGTLEGGLFRRTPNGTIEVALEQLSGVRVGTARLIRDRLGYALKGSLSGSLEVKRGPGHPFDLHGEVDLKLGNARIPDPVVPTRQFGPLRLTDIELGELRLKVRMGHRDEVELGSPRGSKDREPIYIRFSDVSATGEDVELAFQDTSWIRLRPDRPLEQGRMNLHLAIHFTPGFLNEKVEKNGETSQPNSVLKMALKQDPGLEQAVRDGVLGIGCTGRLARPNCDPEPPRVEGEFAQNRELELGSDAPGGRPAGGGGPAAGGGSPSPEPDRRPGGRRGGRGGGPSDRGSGGGGPSDRGSGGGGPSDRGSGGGEPSGSKPIRRRPGGGPGNQIQDELPRPPVRDE